MDESFSGTISRDFWNLIADDDPIGSGMSRIVYRCNIRDDLVIKVEHEAGQFQNIIEWETWCAVSDTEFVRWFAPCEAISACGTILLQKRTKPAADRDYLEKMPSFLCDFKKTNYGIYDRKLVCHDYGTNLLIYKGMTKRLHKANWYEE